MIIQQRTFLLQQLHQLYCITAEYNRNVMHAQISLYLHIICFSSASMSTKCIIHIILLHYITKKQQMDLGKGNEG
jgi:hypothetical protein